MSQVFKKYLADWKGDEAKRALKDNSRMDRDKIQPADISSQGAIIRERANRSFQ